MLIVALALKIEMKVLRAKAALCNKAEVLINCSAAQHAEH